MTGVAIVKERERRAAAAHDALGGHVLVWLIAAIGILRVASGIERPWSLPAISHNPPSLANNHPSSKCALCVP
jgi:hypothetical protein